jgi:hypothetical protein
MTEENKKTLHSIVSAVKDVLYLGGVLGSIFLFFAWAFKPYWEPIALLPEEFLALRKDIVIIQERLSSDLTPKAVDFSGTPIVTDISESYPGGYIEIVYFLRKNVSCETELEIFFYDIFNNRDEYFGVTGSIKAPVTEEFVLFNLKIDLPENIKPGKYTYSPFIKPIECGIYDSLYRVNPTEVFEVKEKP